MKMKIESNKFQAFFELLVLFLLCIVSFLMISQSKVSAQVSLPNLTNMIPHTSHVNNYDENGTKIGDNGWLVVGTGEFNRYLMFLAITSPTNSATITIEHAAICGSDKQDSSHFTGVDAPDNGCLVRRSSPATG